MMNFFDFIKMHLKVKEWHDKYSGASSGSKEAISTIRTRFYCVFAFMRAKSASINKITKIKIFAIFMENRIFSIFFEVVHMIIGGPKWGPDMFKTCFTPFFDLLSYFWAFFENLKKNRFWSRKIAKIDFRGLGFTVLGAKKH